MAPPSVLLNQEIDSNCDDATALCEAVVSVNQMCQQHATGAPPLIESNQFA
jgi:hypothetical protein